MTWINLNDLRPVPPPGRRNVKWQAAAERVDADGRTVADVSAYLDDGGVTAVIGDYTFVAGDRSKLVSWSDASPATTAIGTLPDPSTAGFGNGWFCDVRNGSSHTVTLKYGSPLSTLATLAADQWCRIFSDGVSYRAEVSGVGGGGGSGTTAAFDDNEVPATIDSTHLTLADTPSPAGSLLLVKKLVGGFRIPLIEPDDYSISGAAITLVNATAAGEGYVAWYRKAGGGTSGSGSIHRLAFGKTDSTALTTGAIALPAQVDFAGTIIGWSVFIDTGTISIDVCKHGSSAPPSAPSVPNTTTDKISASAPIVIASGVSASGDATAVSTWTTAVSQWDSLLLNIAAVSGGAKQVQGEILIQES